MHVILLTDQRLFSGPVRNPAFEDLWCGLYGLGTLTVLHILPHDLSPGDDILMPGARALRGRFGTYSVLPHAHGLREALAALIQEAGETLVCLASDSLVPLAVGLKACCPAMTLALLERAAEDGANGPLFRDLFDHIEAWPEGGADALAERLASLAGLGPRRPPAAELLPLGSYHPLTRFYTGHVIVWQGGGDEGFGLRLSHPGGALDANISLDIVEAGHRLTLLEVKAVLPRDVAPETVRLELTADGSGLYDGPLTAGYATRTCDFLALEPTGDEMADVTWWSFGEAGEAPGGAAMVASGGQAVAVTRQTLPCAKPVAIECGTTRRVFHEQALLLDEGAGDDISAFRDRHAGQAAWLIGNGPSVRTEDLEQLSGALTIGFNRLHLAYADMAFRPSYVVSADSQMIEDFGAEIATASEAPVFFAQAARPEVQAPFHWLRQVACFPSVFSRDAGRLVTPGGSSVYVAMQLAYFMGVRRFYFYGADFRFQFQQDLGARDRERSAHGEGNHFIRDYRSGKAWSPPELRNITTAFLTADLLLRAEGGFVRNVTRGGLLDIFERIAFEDALRQDEEDRP